MQIELQDEPRRSRGVLGPSLAGNRPKTDPKISGQIAFRYPEGHRGGLLQGLVVCSPVIQPTCSLCRRLTDKPPLRVNIIMKNYCKSSILGVETAPGAPETIQKGGGRRPLPFGMVLGAPGAVQTPKIDDIR